MSEQVMNRAAAAANPQVSSPLVPSQIFAGTKLCVVGGTGFLGKVWVAMLLHRFPDRIPYEDKLQETDMSYLFSSEAALRSLAENYVGLPF